MQTNSPPYIGSFEELRSLFDYDHALPLKLEEIGVEHKQGVAIHDVSYARLANGRIKAYWVTPAGKGPFPGVIFVHPGPGNRENFLEEAIMLAKQGMASLLIEAPWSQGEAWGRTMGEPVHDRDVHLQFAIDLRRAIDLITTRPEVDASRIGYVGHSFGAIFGGLLAGVERRIKAYVLMAGPISFTDVTMANLPSLQGEALETYRQTLDPIDPIYYIGHAAPAALFFQFGRQDDFFAREKFVAYAEAGSEPKFVQWYNADHYSLNEVGRPDRMEWLGKQLGLK